MYRMLVRLATAASLLGVIACGGDDGDDGGPTTPTPQTGSVAGTVSDGTTGVAGVSVALGSATQSTNASGQFTFSNVAAGSHTLALTPPQGYELATGETAQKQVTVAAGQTASVTWGLRRLNTPAPNSVDVQMQANSFSPPEVTVAVGGTVRWINATPTAHTITPNNPSQAGAWANQNVPATQGFTFTHTFGTAGSYSYNCQLHGGMTGTVRVQ